MNYYHRLYEAAAWLLMLQTEMKEKPFSAVVSRFISDSRAAWSDNSVKSTDCIAVLLALERNGEPMPEDIITFLENNIPELDLKALSDGDRAAAEGDLRTAGAVIDWYKTTPGKIL